MARGGAAGFGGGLQPPDPEAAPEGGRGLSARRASDGQGASAEGAPNPRRQSRPNGKGVLCAWTGSGGSRKSARGLGCSSAPQGSAPSGGCGGGGPPSRMFSTARYVWSGPRAACRHGNKTGAVAAAGARPGWSLGGGGEVGLAGCCLGNGNCGAPPLHPGHGLPTSTPSVPSLAPGPWPVRRSTALGVPFLLPDFFTLT